MTIKTISIDFDKIGKHDQEFIYEVLADYIIEHELGDAPQDAAPHDFVFSYSIDVALEIFDE